jgi:glutathione S-transferase
MPIVHGANLSPFVRKVRVALIEKGIAYELKPLIPFGVGPEYKKKSPLGKIPLYEEGDFTLPDSSCIIAYLEKAHPQPALYPSDPKQFGRALWYEEYADSRMVEIIGGIFFQRVIRKNLMKQDPDEALVQKSIERLPEIFDYLEGEIGNNEFLVGNRFTIADLAVASPLVNLRHGGERIDGKRWPKLDAYSKRIHGRPSYKTLLAEENVPA